MKELKKLVDVKSIVTFTIIGVFAYLAITGKIPVDNIMWVVVAIITFFFARAPSPDTLTSETKTTSTTEVK